MPLSQNEAEILHYLGRHKTATAGNVSRDLRLNRSAVRKALHGLADNKLASVDRATFPASWSISDIGAAVLAAAATGQEPSRTVPRGASHVFRWTPPQPSGDPGDGLWALTALDGPPDATPLAESMHGRPDIAEYDLIAHLGWEWGEDVALTRFDTGATCGGVPVPGYYVTRVDV